MANAPIILFAYNRPLLARQTLLSLKSNQLADQSDLYIFSDGPKSTATESDIKNINEVRKIIRDEQWCKNVTIIEQKNNKGLAASVIDGVSEIVQKNGKVIVIEDDVLLSPYFLKFMNDALQLYENDPRILSIGSWNYFCAPSLHQRDYFFFRYPDSIAWATFARSWDLFEKDAEKALTKLNEDKKMFAFTGNGKATYFEEMLQLQIQGKINSWAIRWTATAVINNMLNVFPRHTLSKHIGFGKESTHEKSEVDYNAALTLSQNQMLLEAGADVKESETALEEWHRFVKGNFSEQQTSGNFGNQLKKALKNKTYRIAHKLIDRITRFKQSEADQLIERALKFPRYKTTEFTYKSFRFKVTDFLSVAYQIKEYFEDERMKANVLGNPLIIDCGSNVGVSLAYFKSIFPGSRIIAFEADPIVFSVLERNVDDNKLTGIELNNKAVWINDLGVEFGSEGADGGSIHFEGKKIKVPSVRLKDIIGQQLKVDLLKIDIEGAEADVLADCGDALRKVKYLFVEYHSLLHTAQNLDRLLNTLTNNGFRYYIHSIGKQSQQPFMSIDPYNGMDAQLDIYAVNSGFNKEN